MTEELTTDQREPSKKQRGLIKEVQDLRNELKKIYLQLGHLDRKLQREFIGVYAKRETEKLEKPTVKIKMAFITAYKEAYGIDYNWGAVEYKHCSFLLKRFTLEQAIYLAEKYPYWKKDRTVVESAHDFKILTQRATALVADIKNSAARSASKAQNRAHERADKADTEVAETLAHAIASRQNTIGETSSISHEHLKQIQSET